MSKESLEKLKAEVQALANPQKAVQQQKYFKTGKGEYAQGDVFLGLTVPQSRKIAKTFYKDINLQDAEVLIKSKNHEERLIALHILVLQYAKAAGPTQKAIFDFYLAHTAWINNWDLVDLSARDIVGAYLYNKDKHILEKLARSENLWEKRIAIISTSYFTQKKQSAETLSIAKILLQDPHDLIHKAVGWMLREVGKRDSQATLEAFLETHAAVMPRTMLRYAIEHFPEEKRQYYLKMKTNRLLSL